MITNENGEIVIPFAQFRWDGRPLSMTRTQFEQALRDARVCGCGECLCCRAAQYERHAGEHRSRPGGPL